MKTLDEVINELHYWDTCDEFPESFYDFEVTRDALHYLREYRSDQIQWEADRKNWQDQYAQAVENFKSSTAKHLEALKEIKGKNDPLTWDELRTMEGKPVWIECAGSFWAVIVCVEENRFWYRCRWADHDYCDREYMGEHWQAYRKERSS
ncbi:MAG: hypothetical protein IJ906_04150 [Oscillospiraceae bacterium]|nr:hypothetical protein [Oscillospiraceae bacterium]